MINYAQFTTAQLETMAKHGATEELRDRAKAEQMIRAQEQQIFELRKEKAALEAAIASYKAEAEMHAEAASDTYRAAMDGSL